MVPICPSNPIEKALLIMFVLLKIYSTFFLEKQANRRRRLVIEDAIALLLSYSKEDDNATEISLWIWFLLEKELPGLLMIMNIMEQKQTCFLVLKVLIIQQSIKKTL